MNGYCEQHQTTPRDYDRFRGSAQDRGYDWQWSCFRNEYLRRHPRCRDCEAEGRVALAEEVHHMLKVREHPERKYDETILMGLCKHHHSIRTKRGE